MKAETKQAIDKRTDSGSVSSRIKLAGMVAILWVSCVCHAGEPSPVPAPAGSPPAPAGAPPLPEVNDSELGRVERIANTEFPWKKLQAPPPPVPIPAEKNKPAPPDSAMPDMSSGDIIVKSMGTFSREEKAGQEIITLTKEVEIEQIEAKSVLRGETVYVIRDLKTGELSRLEAKGAVEMVTTERKGRGESMISEVKYGPNHEVLKDRYFIEGDRSRGIKAILWHGEDITEADKFEIDNRLDTFHLMGNPATVVKMPEEAPPAAVPGAPAVPAPKPAAPAGGGGMMPDMSFSGGKIRMQAEGEMFYEGASGRLKMSRNVMIQRGANLIINADEAYLTMLLPPPGQEDPNGGVFAGTPIMLECKGRVELKTPTHTVLSDRTTLDFVKKLAIMEMKVPKDLVKVYMKETPTEGKVMSAAKRLVINTETGEFQAAGSSHMETYTGIPPSNRIAPPLNK